MRTCYSLKQLISDTQSVTTVVCICEIYAWSHWNKNWRDICKERASKDQKGQIFACCRLIQPVINQKSRILCCLVWLLVGTFCHLQCCPPLLRTTHCFTLRKNAKISSHFLREIFAIQRIKDMLVYLFSSLSQSCAKWGLRTTCSDYVISSVFSETIHFSIHQTCWCFSMYYIEGGPHFMAWAHNSFHLIKVIHSCFNLGPLRSEWSKPFQQKVFWPTLHNSNEIGLYTINGRSTFKFIYLSNLTILNMFHNF